MKLSVLIKKMQASLKADGDNDVVWEAVGSHEDVTLRLVEGEETCNLGCVHAFKHTVIAVPVGED
jgi:hypothetical protein